MNNIKTIKSQFAAIAEKVDNEDRLMAAVEFKKHVETINRYLRGEIRKESFGLKLLGFMKNRIAEREKAIA
jgi:hypothetical protein